MSEDVLRAATRALREESPPADPARFTRARVMASLHKRERRRTTKLAFLLPIAAVLVGSTAFGAAGGRLPASWQSKLGMARAADAPSLARPAERGAELVRRAPKPAALPAAAPAEEAQVAPAAAPVQEGAVVPAVDKPMQAAPAPDPSHDMYRAAHKKHFAEGDAAGALAAWDAYLAAAPRGRFSTEARYNRALCLVRLGRTSEARAALEPFAAGRFGGYRQREASELSEALGR